MSVSKGLENSRLRRSRSLTSLYFLHPEEAAKRKYFQGLARCLWVARPVWALPARSRATLLGQNSSCSSSSEPDGPWRTSSYHLLVRLFIWMRPWWRSWAGRGDKPGQCGGGGFPVPGGLDKAPGNGRVLSGQLWGHQEGAPEKQEVGR